MKINLLIRVLTFYGVLLFENSCIRKLDIKPDQTLVVPDSPSDLVRIIDQNSVMNSNYPVLGEAGSDNYYLLTSRWLTLRVPDQNIYIWEKDLFPSGVTVIDWTRTFQKILFANTVLDGLEKFKGESSSVDYTEAKGYALFFRAFAYYQAAQVFCKPFNSSTAASDLGLPLRLNANVNIPSTRASLEETYKQILADMVKARDLLPSSSNYKTRPTKLAVDAALARIFLSMNEYQKAFQYANASINSYPILMDYNNDKSISTSSSNPFKIFNSEVIFHAELWTGNSTGGTFFFNVSSCPVDTNLFKSYDPEDLRRELFFKKESSGLITWKGSYVGNSNLFGGIANDEIYLIRAECNARLGNTQAAMDDLNNLLSKRFKTGSFKKINVTDANDALSIILKERRKELLFRGLRWSDLRRLNLLNANITLARYINGQTYTLPPNDTRYVYPIPQDEVTISGLQQNER